MRKIFNIKRIIAYTLYYLGISKLLFLLNLSKKQSVRILNYHDTLEENNENLKKQLEFYKKYYEILDFEKLKKFLENKYTLRKQGLLITFDDGLSGNYKVANDILSPLGIGAIFFVSPDKINKDGYMTKNEIEELLGKKIYSIGSHTCSHHRMNKNDSIKKLNYEIIESKNKLEKKFKIKIESFCWCGGELNTYTKDAYDIIKNTYKYSFMTNNKPVYNNENKLWLQRTNIEDSWSIPLIVFQLCGLLDIKYIEKRKIILERLNSEKGGRI